MGGCEEGWEVVMRGGGCEEGWEVVRRDGRL